MPTDSAACKIDVPFLASTTFPSIVKRTILFLQDLCYEYGVAKTTYEGEQTDLPIDDSNPFFTYNPNLCILCHRCVNTCHKIVGR